MHPRFILKKQFRSALCAAHSSAAAFAAIFLMLFALACKPRLFNADSNAESDIANVENVNFSREELLGKYRFDRITPTGEKIFAASLEWVKGQEREASRFAKPAQCANNVSRVLEMAGINSYSSPLLMDMVNAARRRNGLVIELPKEPKAIARLIEENFAGALPVGAFISGCLNRDCSGEAGDGHISIVGQVDSNDELHLWHNNWFRPENRPWRQHMIPLNWYQAGFPRKWMSTPWISRKRNDQGALVDIGVIIPEIDDLDPTNYFVTLTIIPEILSEMRAGRALTTDGMGSVMPFRARSSNQPSQPTPLPSPPPLVDCRNLKTISPTPTNLRVEPNGEIICKFAMGTPLERISNTGSWTQVKGMCPDGTLGEGFVLSALVVPACEQ